MSWFCKNTFSNLHRSHAHDTALSVRRRDREFSLKYFGRPQNGWLADELDQRPEKTGLLVHRKMIAAANIRLPKPERCFGKRRNKFGNKKAPNIGAW